MASIWPAQNHHLCHQWLEQRLKLMQEKHFYFLSEVTFLTRLCPSISLHVKCKESWNHWKQEWSAMEVKSAMEACNGNEAQWTWSSWPLYASIRVKSQFSYLQPAGCWHVLEMSCYWTQSMNMIPPVFQSPSVYGHRRLSLFLSPESWWYSQGY